MVGGADETAAINRCRSTRSKRAYYNNNNYYKFRVEKRIPFLFFFFAKRRLTIFNPPLKTLKCSINYRPRYRGNRKKKNK